MQKVATVVFRNKVMFSKQPKPAQNIFATFVRQLIPGNLQKIAQSGHTEFSVPQQSVNSSCSFCVGTSFAFGLFRPNE